MLLACAELLPGSSGIGQAGPGQLGVQSPLEQAVVITDRIVLELCFILPTCLLRGLYTWLTTARAGPARTSNMCLVSR